MENTSKHLPPTAGGITQLGDDLLQNILAKLPAKSFGSAACVSRSWSDICTRILSRPNLCSSISLNPLLPEAMKEVVGKVLSGPIKPHFAILCIFPTIDLEEAHRLITEELSSSIPIVTSSTAGIIGRDALSDQFWEVNFPCSDEEDIVDPPNCGGISLTVGYVPGMKVDAIPLLSAEEGPSINKFVMDVREYSASISGCTSPEAIIMFGIMLCLSRPLSLEMKAAASSVAALISQELPLYVQEKRNHLTKLLLLYLQGIKIIWMV